MIFFKKQKPLKIFPFFKYTISGQSMQPALKHGDTVLVSRLSYLFKSPKVRDMVALKDPRDKKTFIKRITKIKNDTYFVVGDNKRFSTDSRNFGWIAKKDIIGKIVYPHDKFSI